MALLNFNERLVVTLHESTFADSGNDDKGRPTLWDINQVGQFQGTRAQCLIYALKMFDPETERYSFVVKKPALFQQGRSDWNAALPVLDVFATGVPKIEQRELDIADDVTNHFRDLNKQVILTIWSPVDMDSVPAGERHNFVGTRAQVLAYLLKKNPTTGEQHYLQAQYALTDYNAISNQGVVYDPLMTYGGYSEVTLKMVELINNFLTRTNYNCVTMW